jgi:hypothetical protein
MSEEITNVNTVQQPTTTEGQTGAAPATQENSMVNVSTENNTVDNVQPAVGEQVENAQATDITDKFVEPKQDVNVEALQQQVQEYQAKEQETRELLSRLGTDGNTDIQVLEAIKQRDIIDNQAQQAYVKLCNKYGVDYRAENIEASAKALKEKDPQAYYDLQYELGQLDSIVNEKRGVIDNFITHKQVQTSLNRYGQLLNASPALKQQLNSYLNTVPLTDPVNQIDTFMQMATAIQREAIEIGKILAQQQAQAQSPANVLNNSVMAQQTSYAATPPKTWTRQEIAAMSDKEFAKYEKEIDRAVREGRVI